MTLKRRRAGRSKARGVGWAAETFQESDVDEGLGRQPLQRPKVLHPHAIVNATPASSQSSIVNAFTDAQPIPVSKCAPKPFNFLDTTPPNLADPNSDSALDMDSIFEEYNLMDPELSAAWDEDHGLQSKRARTASVK